VEEEARLVSVRAKGQTSVARVTDDWYPVCLSRDLERKPVAATLFGTPLAVFRTDDGTAGALLDRCPHRNVPLSNGRVVGPHLQCEYHGWQFDPRGTCKAVPGLVGIHEARGRRVKSFACREQQGLIWVYATPDAEPERAPYRFPFVDDPGYTSVIEHRHADLVIQHQYIYILSRGQHMI
jgi:phenylpropionate dioxygenase-like ring-hydroxylating dioxygenase large terminal subunit